MRTTALGLSSTFSRVGAVAAPLLMYLGSSDDDDDDTSSSSIRSRLPLAAYGVFMAAAAAAALWLWPETAAAALPDTMEEGERAATRERAGQGILCCLEDVVHKEGDGDVVGGKEDASVSTTTAVSGSQDASVSLSATVVAGEKRDSDSGIAEET